MATCDIQTLVNQAACLGCMPVAQLQAIKTDLLCNYLVNPPSPPIPPAFSYEPDTATIYWTDNNGSFGPVDRATFFATADIASVSAVTFSGVTVTSISNLSQLPALTLLYCNDNALTTLDVTGCTALTTLICYYNALTTLDVTSLTALTALYCSFNSLTTLDVSNNTALTTLYCDNNALTILAVNTILSDLVTNGQVGGTVDCSLQTPAAPPSAGPPNGIVANATLLAEVPAWTVTTD